MKTITTVNGDSIVLSGREVFVTMTDKFLSGWGCAEGRIEKRVVICSNKQQAYKLKDRLSNPKYMMKHVNIFFDIPYYMPSKYHVSWDVYDDNKFTY